MNLHVELAPGHDNEDRRAALLSTPVGAYVRAGNPPHLRTYHRRDDRNYGVAHLGYFRDGDSADQDIRLMCKEDQPWVVEVTHLPVDHDAMTDDKACIKWDREHPDLMGLRPGSVIRVPSDLLYVVQPGGQWVRLRPNMAIEGCWDTMPISPEGAEWSDAVIVWSAP